MMTCLKQIECFNDNKWKMSSSMIVVIRTGNMISFFSNWKLFLSL
jgi:hypothetical protein